MQEIRHLFSLVSSDHLHRNIFLHDFQSNILICGNSFSIIITWRSPYLPVVYCSLYDRTSKQSADNSPDKSIVSRTITCNNSHIPVTFTLQLQSAFKLLLLCSSQCEICAESIEGFSQPGTQCATQLGKKASVTLKVLI